MSTEADHDTPTDTDHWLPPDIHKWMIGIINPTENPLSGLQSIDDAIHNLDLGLKHYNILFDARTVLPYEHLTQELRQERFLLHKRFRSLASRTDEAEHRLGLLAARLQQRFDHDEDPPRQDRELWAVCKSIINHHIDSFVGRIEELWAVGGVCCRIHCRAAIWPRRALRCLGCNKRFHPPTRVRAQPLGVPVCEGLGCKSVAAPVEPNVCERCKSPAPGRWKDRTVLYDSGSDDSVEIERVMERYHRYMSRG